MKEKKFIPMNIQLFAEQEPNNDDGNGGNGTQKTYSQEEFDKLVAERDKYKKANDDLSKENADYKRKAKDKLSEEEKLAQAQKEKDEALANAQKELLSIKMSKEFMVAGFDETSTNKIIDSFNKGDSVEFAKTLSQEIKNLVENARKQEKENFQKSSTLPPNGSYNKNGLDPVVERYINNKKTNTNSAREQLFGKK